MLHLNTIDPPLFQVLVDISQLPELSNFSLVGGTSLSLQLGHRKSDDLDFFTDRSFNIGEVKEAILRYNSGVIFLNETRQGISFSLPLSSTGDDDIRKLDVYNWAVKFIRPTKQEGKIRLASLEDIAAFKLDAICHRKEKKDYVDIAVLLESFSFGQMLDFYREKFPMNDGRIVLSQVLDTEGLENSVEPVMLIDLDPAQALQRIQQKIADFNDTRVQKKNSSKEDRANEIAELIKNSKQKSPTKKGKSL
jgi:predicted nucleotidyltransferase component of viral defense system